MAGQPLLLCYDGSANAAHAIAAAGRLVGGGPALVCHAWPPLSALMAASGASASAPPASAVERIDAADAERAAEVAAEGARIASDAGFDAQPLPVKQAGTTWQAILDTAAAHRSPLVVVGAHGRSAVGRALLGSVSTGVVHHAHLPVLVVPEAPEGQKSGGPLLLAYDGSADARRAIESATLLRERRAVVLHLWESWVAHAPTLAGVSGAVRGMAEELDEIAAERSAQHAADGVAAAQAAGFEAQPISARATGPLWAAVLDAADDCEAAAIAMGARGLTGLSAALGSVSTGVVHHSRRPVFIVPPEAASA